MQCCHHSGNTGLLYNLWDLFTFNPFKRKCFSSYGKWNCYISFNDTKQYDVWKFNDIYWPNFQNNLMWKITFVVTVIVRLSSNTALNWSRSVMCATGCIQKGTQFSSLRAYINYRKEIIFLFQSELWQPSCVLLRRRNKTDNNRAKLCVFDYRVLFVFVISVNVLHH